MRFKPDLTQEREEQVLEDYEIDDMLDVCMRHVRGEGLAFIESLNEQYEKSGFLTPKQQEALRKFYGRIVGD